jgi:hypothetical protein
MIGFSILFFEHVIFLPYLTSTPNEINTFKASYTLLFTFCSYFSCISHMNYISFLIFTEFRNKLSCNILIGGSFQLLNYIINSLW